MRLRLTFALHMKISFAKQIKGIPSCFVYLAKNKTPPPQDCGPEIADKSVR